MCECCWRSLDERGDTRAEVLSVAREEGIESGFNVKQWWEVMRQVRFRLARVLVEYIDTYIPLGDDQRDYGSAKKTTALLTMMKFWSCKVYLSLREGGKRTMWFATSCFHL